MLCVCRAQSLICANSTVFPSLPFSIFLYLNPNSFTLPLSLSLSLLSPGDGFALAYANGPVLRVARCGTNLVRNVATLAVSASLLNSTNAKYYRVIWGAYFQNNISVVTLALDLGNGTMLSTMNNVTITTFDWSGVDKAGLQVVSGTACTSTTVTNASSSVVQVNTAYGYSLWPEQRFSEVPCEFIVVGDKHTLMAMFVCLFLYLFANLLFVYLFVCLFVDLFVCL